MTDQNRWRSATVISSDGTPISHRSTGVGPGLVIVPGNNRRAYHYDKLAIALADRRTVHTLDRRGRGESGAQGDHYSADAEADDVAAVLDATGSDSVFGHSYGGLIALRLALRRTMRRLALYEPGISLGGGFDLDWLPEFNAKLARGRRVAAMTVFLRKAGIVPIGKPPRFMFRLLATALLYGGEEGAETRRLMPTTPLELGEIARLDSDGSEYGAVRTRALLLAGTRTNPYLPRAVTALSAILPDSSFEILEGLDHNAPDLSAVATIAGRLEPFFA